MRLAPWLLLLATACPSKGAQNPQPVAGAGCPSAAGVYVASYVQQEKGRSGWVVPLQAMQVDPSANVPDYANLDASAAAASGVPAAPAGTSWLVTANAAPCRATAGKYYAAKVEGPPASLSYGVELDGCAAPANPDEGGGIVLVSEEAPLGCRFETPRPVAARLGEMTEQKTWQRPTKETPIPLSLAGAIPQHDCKPPACEMLWAFGEVAVNGSPIAWSGAVNWLAVGDPAQQCKWPAERFSGFFVPVANTATKVDEGQDHPLVLSAVLADNAGAKVMLAEGPGEYATYDVVLGNTPRLGHHVTWMFAPHEAYDAVDHLGPICEPEPAAPAPMPKNAKPQSPY